MLVANQWFRMFKMKGIIITIINNIIHNINIIMFIIIINNNVPLSVKQKTVTVIVAAAAVETVNEIVIAGTGIRLSATNAMVIQKNVIIIIIITTINTCLTTSVVRKTSK